MYTSLSEHPLFTFPQHLHALTLPLPQNLERQTVVFGMPMWQLPDQVSRYYPSLATANAVALTLVLQPFAEEAAGLDDRLGLDCSAAPQRCLMRRFLGSMFKDVLGVDWPAAGSQTTYIRYDSSSRPVR